MKNYTTSKKIIVIAGYAVSIIMLVYFIYNTYTTVYEISLFEREIGRLSFEEKFRQVMPCFVVFAQAFALALATKLYAVFMQDKTAKHLSKGEH